MEYNEAMIGVLIGLSVAIYGLMDMYVKPSFSRVYNKLMDRYAKSWSAKEITTLRHALYRGLAGCVALLLIIISERGAFSLFAVWDGDTSGYWAIIDVLATAGIVAAGEKGIYWVLNTMTSSMGVALLRWMKAKVNHEID